MKQCVHGLNHRSCGACVAIQLGAADIPHDLADALASYERAIAIDPKCIEAYEEIGRFYDAIMDDSESAKPFFHQAAVLKNELSG